MMIVTLIRIFIVYTHVIFFFIMVCSDNSISLLVNGYNTCLSNVRANPTNPNPTYLTLGNPVQSFSWGSKYTLFHFCFVYFVWLCWRDYVDKKWKIQTKGCCMVVIVFFLLRIVVVLGLLVSILFTKFLFCLFFFNSVELLYVERFLIVGFIE